MPIPVPRAESAPAHTGTRAGAHRTARERTSPLGVVAAHAVPARSSWLPRVASDVARTTPAGAPRTVVARRATVRTGPEGPASLGAHLGTVINTVEIAQVAAGGAR